MSAPDPAPEPDRLKNRVAAMLLTKIGCVWNGEFWEGFMGEPSSADSPLSDFLRSKMAEKSLDVRRVAMTAMVLYTAENYRRKGEQNK